MGPGEAFVIQSADPQRSPGDEGYFVYWPEGKITGIVITYYDKYVGSIAFESTKDDGSVSFSRKFGNDDDQEYNKTYTASFSSGEYITGLGTTPVNNYIGSVWVYTNVKTYSPFSDTRERTSMRKAGMHAAGFFGVYGSRLFVIGVYFKAGTPNSVLDNKNMSIGPLGGPEDQGKSWTFIPPKNHQISEIIIRHGLVVNYIVFQSMTRDGAVAFSPRFGGNGGTITEKISFGPGEYITGMEVMIGDFSRTTVVYSLSICTNVNTYGPFGTVSGTPISIPIREGNVVGFFGRSSTYLNAIGVHAVAKTKSTGPFQDKKGPLGGKTWEECILIGPWGGSGGRPWTYRPTEFVTKLAIRHESCINSISFHTTARNGTDKVQRFGTRAGKFDEVPISSGEYITGLEMTVGDYDGQSVITQLSICTNVTTYGPYGIPTGSKIFIPIKDGRIAGFYGRAGKYINSIGIFAII